MLPNLCALVRTGRELILDTTSVRSRHPDERDSDRGDCHHRPLLATPRPRWRRRILRSREATVANALAGTFAERPAHRNPGIHRQLPKPARDPPATRRTFPRGERTLLACPRPASRMRNENDPAGTVGPHAQRSTGLAAPRAKRAQPAPSPRQRVAREARPRGKR